MFYSLVTSLTEKISNRFGRASAHALIQPYITLLVCVLACMQVHDHIQFTMNSC